eukprot:CAMPEP_0119344070 /NCGR_PEP_ID=MMETSP1333-20130426/106780_1 /TAXON_ID=418940 /ORGANISM="Scyphosphaera apsteinii, Strain RCC1455" /LENGTH=80 /DNA_ID=CAMNT_0007356493 /DNA_START=117 /DNA_END=359 /DNA_ORIENTATION=+
MEPMPSNKVFLSYLERTYATAAYVTAARKPTTTCLAAIAAAAYLAATAAARLAATAAAYLATTAVARLTAIAVDRRNAAT